MVSIIEPFLIGVILLRAEGAPKKKKSRANNHLAITRKNAFEDMRSKVWQAMKSEKIINRSVILNELQV